VITGASATVQTSDGTVLSQTGEKTLAELAELHDVHTTQVAVWKAQLPKGAADVFSSGSPRNRRASGWS
jgi:transposase-like protein